MSARWRRVALEPSTGVRAAYETTDGRWSVVREHYADGPSLFTWVLYEETASGQVWRGEYPTKRAAVRAAHSVPRG